MTLENLESIWRWADLIQRGIYIGLALMLAHTVFVLIRFLRRYPPARHQCENLRSNSSLELILKSRDLVSELSRGLRILKAIGSAAPFLGLAGTSYGILAGFYTIHMYGGSVVAYLVTETSSRLVTAATGLIVAIPAVVIHHALHNRVEILRKECATKEPTYSVEHTFRRAQTLPLGQRFSGLPPYALVASPVFAIVIFVYLLFKPYELPKGLPVRVALERCETGLVDRQLVLRVTEAGNLFLNLEQESRGSLPGRLVEIYKLRQDRVLYLQADDRVPFQRVAEAIDLTRNIFGTGPGSQNITVRLITPSAQAESARCHTLISSAPPVRMQK